MIRTISVLLLLGAWLPSCSSPPATTAPVDAAPAPATAPTNEPTSEPTSEAPSEPTSEAPAAGDALALRHPGSPRTRSSGEITGPTAPEVPAAGKFASPCASHKPGESWESEGATCHCNPAGEVRCARATEFRREHADVVR